MLRIRSLFIPAAFFFWSAAGSRVLAKLNADSTEQSDSLAVVGSEALDDQFFTQVLEKADVVGHEEACDGLLLAFAIGVVAVPIPIVGTITQVMGLAACCPVWVLTKVKATVASMGLSKAKKYILEWKDLTPAERLFKQEDEQREVLIELYSDLVYEQNSRAAVALWGKLKSSVTHSLGKFSGKDFGTDKILLNHHMRNKLEEEMPWLLYPRIAYAHLHEKLTKQEKWDFVLVMLKLKETYPWLPTLDTLGIKRELTLPEELFTPEKVEELSLLEEFHDAQETATVEQGLSALDTISVSQRMAKALGAKRDFVCQALARACTGAANAMKRWMNKPSGFSLNYLRAKVAAMLAGTVASPVVQHKIGENGGLGEIFYDAITGHDLVK